MSDAAICFDATGTLIETAEPVGEVYRRVALEHGVDLPAWRLDDAFRRILRAAPARGLEGSTERARIQGEIDWWFERIRQTFQATDSTVRFDDFEAFAAALFDAYRSATAWRTREGSRDALLSLRRDGFSLGVVSNFDHRLPKILEGLEIAMFFDIVAIPSTCGSAKPDRGIFEMAGAALGRSLDGLVYVGDDAPDVLEAISDLGVRVLDLHRTKGLRDVPDLARTAATLPRSI